MAAFNPIEIEIHAFGSITVSRTGEGVTVIARHMEEMSVLDLDQAQARQLSDALLRAADRSAA